MGETLSLSIQQSWWDKVVEFFQSIDGNLLFLIVSSVLVFLIFVLVFVGMLVDRKRTIGFNARFADEDSSPKIVTINTPHQQVISFSMRDIANKEIETMSRFYSRFPSG